MTSRLLFLGKPSPIYSYLCSLGDRVDLWDAPLEQLDTATAYDWIVSYNYRYRVPASVLEQYGKRAINCHVAFLPYNRGAHPNVWAWYDGTPHGVTIHQMEATFDTGPILGQRRVLMEEHAETLKSSYDRLHAEMFALFVEYWPFIKRGTFQSHPQPEGGSLHYSKDLAVLLPILHGRDWQVPVTEIVEAGQTARRRTA